MTKPDAWHTLQLWTFRSSSRLLIILLQWLRFVAKLELWQYRSSAAHSCSQLAGSWVASVWMAEAAEAPTLPYANQSRIYESR